MTADDTQTESSETVEDSSDTRTINSIVKKPTMAKNHRTHGFILLTVLMLLFFSMTRGVAFRSYLRKSPVRFAKGVNACVLAINWEF